MQIRKNNGLIAFSFFGLLAAGLTLAPAQTAGGVAMADNAKGDWNVLTNQAGAWVHAYLLQEANRQFQARQTEVQALDSAEAVLRRQTKLRAAYRQIMGEFPKPAPLNPRVTGTIPGNGYRIEKVAYESRPNFFVTANLYLPAAGKGPYPGVLVVCGHWAEAKFWQGHQRFGALCALNGLVALVVDPISQGERMQLLDAKGRPAQENGQAVYIRYFEHSLIDTGARLVGWSAAALEAWDNMRGIDYLYSRPEVDRAKKVGCTGSSGGGTQTTFLMALDERIGPAAPSCYLTTAAWVFNGKQRMNDGCQHIAGEGKFGIERTDYILLHAPNPTLVLAAQDDFFDINNTRALVNEAKKFYALLGVPERLDLFVAPGGHDFSKPHREKAVQWFRRWLLNDDRPISEPDLPVQPPAALQVTRGGQAGAEWTNAVSAFDLIKNQARQAEAARQEFWKKNDRQAGLAKVKELTGFKPADKVAVAQVGRIIFTNYTVEKLVFTPEGEVPLPALLFLPQARPKPAPAILYVDGNGKVNLANTNHFLRAKLNAGTIILAVDVRGVGETKDNLPYEYKTHMANEDWVNEMLAMHLGRPLFGQRIGDVLAALEALRQRPEVDPAAVELVGAGWCGPIALHAAAFDGRIQRVTLSDSIRTWLTLLDQPLAHNRLRLIVPGALQCYDLPDLVKTLPPAAVAFETSP
jgi:cephalosporin-C deacetylase-like acetyl esterase